MLSPYVSLEENKVAIHPQWGSYGECKGRRLSRGSELHIGHRNEAERVWRAGMTGYGTQICMTFALQNARAAPAIAMSYLSVVWSLLAGILLFHEIPNAMCAYYLL